VCRHPLNKNGRTTADGGPHAPWIAEEQPLKRSTDDPLNDLDPDIAEVLMSRLDFREDPEEAESDEPQEEEPAVAVKWTPPADEAAAPARVVRALTGNRTHKVLEDQIAMLAAEQGLSLAVAEQVVTGRMTLRSALNLRRMRAAKARRDKTKAGPMSSKRLVALFAALMGVFVWVLFIM